jgi:hypothetical protein
LVKGGALCTVHEEVVKGQLVQVWVLTENISVAVQADPFVAVTEYVPLAAELIP